MKNLGEHLVFFILPTKVLSLSIKKGGLVELLIYFFNNSSQKLTFVAPLVPLQSKGLQTLTS